jgi:hypothetical protein
LEEVQVTQPLDLRVVHRMGAWRVHAQTGCRRQKPAQQAPR